MTRSPIQPAKRLPSVAIQSAANGAFQLVFGGDWLIREGVPDAASIAQQLAQVPAGSTIAFDMRGVGAWDSGLFIFLAECKEQCEQQRLEWQNQTLPPQVANIITLSEAVPERKDAKRTEVKPGFVTAVGERAWVRLAEATHSVTFVGECALALARLLRGRAQFQWADVLGVMHDTGPKAIGIVALINFIVGMIIAFVGAVQLAKFGAGVYVADLVAIATVREMGCLMTGIIICGRTGASFAAQLGTMKVNEEIDALQTFRISAIDFLVLPRMLALLLAMPFLCVFADLIAIVGGCVVAVAMLDVTGIEYVLRVVQAISLTGFLIGIFKGSVFGAIIAITGCLTGLQCGSSSAAVGKATTTAVVVGITAVIATDGVFAVLFFLLGI